MNYFIKILEQADASNYRSLRLNSYQESPYSFSESYEDEKEKDAAEFAKELAIIGDPPEHFVLGAFSKNKGLIGFVKFRKDQRSKAIHKSMIHAMYVDPAHRKKGIGRALVLELISMTKKLPSLEQIHLWVLHSDKTTSASNFYKSLDFISQGSLVKKDLKIGDNYIDAEYMVLYLQ